MIKNIKAKNIELNRFKFLIGVLVVIVIALIATANFTILNHKILNVSSSSASAQEPADINNDKKVDIVDLSILLSNWNQSGTDSDLNFDNTVDIFDLSILLAKWGTIVSDGCKDGEIGSYPDCAPAPPAPTASGKQWNLVYNEDFNGNTLDTNKLSPCFDWNYGGCTQTFNNGRELYSPEQVRISEGTAKLVAEPLDTPVPSDGCYQGECTYKAGLVSTARPRADNGSDYLFPFTYGYVESKMKFPGRPGFFTAFWMLPTNPDYNYPTEIDIVEILGGYPETIFMNYHYNNRSQSYSPNNGLNNNGSCQVQDYSADWVTFGLDWQPNHIAWYIDGVKCGQFNGDPSTIEDGPMQIILHMMIDNSWERDWGSVLTSLDQVDQLEVDYLRIFQQQ